MDNLLQTNIAYLKGIGPVRAKKLAKELSIKVYQDLLTHYPFRYQDRTRFYDIKDIEEGMPHIQLKGTITDLTNINRGSRKRLKATFKDTTGTLSLVWFNRIEYIRKIITLNTPYYIFGKPTLYNGKFSINHPELNNPFQENSQHLYPIYSTTEKLSALGLDSKGIVQAQRTLLTTIAPHIVETLPAYLLAQHKLISKKKALQYIHFAPNTKLLEEARHRLAFEELFYLQLRLLRHKKLAIEKSSAQVFANTTLLTHFYHHHLPFNLTVAQKKVLKEIFKDLSSGKQMNRLLQGDVGSGKTMVAFLSMLLPWASDAQVVLMAPTEILAQQHYHSLISYAQKLNITIDLLTGSTPKKKRKVLYKPLADGSLRLLIGTHALLEDKVQFKQLGLAIIDEQHRFGVVQRTKLLVKNNQQQPPHILVMSATPIPRTLAMTLYGSLDVSTIDELPPGRLPIKTVHRYDAQRLPIFTFIKKQLAQGKQAYIVYPLVEGPSKLAYKDVMDGYTSISRAFPNTPIGILYGNMKPANKAYEMQRFVKGDTKIMVATTVIEVGIDVPNATVMIIENAERFGLAQLHQLRGRIGRGATQSYCILMTGYKLSVASKIRIDTMVATHDGFEIAEADLQLRGPGNLVGIEQSGVLALKIADLKKDGAIVQKTRTIAEQILKKDPNLTNEAHHCIQQELIYLVTHTPNWSSVS